MEQAAIIELSPRKVIVRGETPCESARECRICLSAEQQGNELLSLCGCSGSVQFVHGQCFKEWVRKKAEDPFQREQVLSPQGLSCEVCHQKYRYTYQLITKYADCQTFRIKVANRISLALATVSLLIIDLVLLALMMGYAIDDPRNPDYDMKQPRFYMVYIALGFALLSTLYGILQFAKLFLLYQTFQLTPGDSRSAFAGKFKLPILPGVTEGGNPSELMQESHMRMQNSTRLVQYI